MSRPAMPATTTTRQRPGRPITRPGPTGVYSFSVTGTDGTTTRTATIDVQVTSTTGTFTLTCSPSNFNVVSPFSKTTKCTVRSLNGFIAAVSFSCEGQPASVGCDFAPPTVTPPPGGTATTTLSVTGSAATGQYTFQAVGTGGGLTVEESLSLRVRP